MTHHATASRALGQEEARAPSAQPEDGSEYLMEKI